MRTREWSIALAGALVLATSGPADEKELRTTIDRALKAVGGADKVAKHPAATWNGKGILPGRGGLAFTVRGARQGPEQLRLRVRLDDGDQIWTRVLVVGGGTGWLKLNRRAREFSKDELAEEKERMYANWVATLAPLVQDKDFALAPAPAVKGGRDLVGVKVTRKGRRDVLLYFDKKTGELAMREATIVDVLAGGKKIKEQVWFADYRPTPAGVKHARRVKVVWDGKVVSETEITEIAPAASLPASAFPKP
jgi:hypothetical protein